MLRSYHVVLTSGAERDVKASDIDVPVSGTLIFLNVNREASVTYAPGTWVMVEVETRDDRGESEP
jgi:hypothetical protein